MSEGISLGRRGLGMLGLGLAAAATGMAPGPQRRAAAAPPGDGTPIKVGVLHSLSGTMVISETTLKC